MSFELVYHLRKLMEGLSKEYEGHLLRCIPSSYDPRDYKYIQMFGAADKETAEIIDYRSSLPPVFDQGQRGSCVACASAWTVKAYEEIQQGDYPADGLSAAFLYALCKQYDGAPEQEGTMPRTAMKILKKYGICPEDLMPYSTLTELPEPQVPSVSGIALGAAVNYRIQTYAQLCSSADLERSQIIAVMRQALKQEGPFLLALLVCDNFKPDKNNILPIPDGEVRGGHAVGIVGDIPEQRCFILRNSWGSAWGDEGYALLPYEWMTTRQNGAWDVFEAWTATDLVVTKRASRMEIKPGMNYMLVDGVRVPINQPALMGKTSSIVMPIKEVAEYMGYNFEWDGRKAVLTRSI